MLFTCLSIIMLFASIILRMTRGKRIINKPRGIEKLVVWRIKNRVIHLHHAYLGFILLPIGYLLSSDTTTSIVLALIVSDLLFHVIARVIFNDPFWD